MSALLTSVPLTRNPIMNVASRTFAEAEGLGDVQRHPEHRGRVDSAAPAGASSRSLGGPWKVRRGLIRGGAPPSGPARWRSGCRSGSPTPTGTPARSSRAADRRLGRHHDRAGRYRVRPWSPRLAGPLARRGAGGPVARQLMLTPPRPPERPKAPVLTRPAGTVVTFGQEGVLEPFGGSSPAPPRPIPAAKPCGKIFSVIASLPASVDQR